MSKGSTSILGYGVVVLFDKNIEVDFISLSPNQLVLLCGVLLNQENFGFVFIWALVSGEMNPNIGNRSTTNNLVFIAMIFGLTIIRNTVYINNSSQRSSIGAVGGRL